jgi:ubiquinone/menaquinone biosynthesis C-methylase UbiE
LNPYSDKFAKYYDLFFGNEASDLEFYRYYIEQQGGLALEVGSGTGRLLLSYLKYGLKVQGIEPSQEMVQICQNKAKKTGVKPVIYNQSIEALKLIKKFKTIYMPLYIFQYLSDENKAINALENCYKCLESDGLLLVSIFVCNKQSRDEFIEREVKREKDSVITLYESITYDKVNKIQTKSFKIENYKVGKLEETVLSTIQFKCYSKDQLETKLKKIGFSEVEVLGDYHHQEAGSNSEVLVFKAKK